MNNDRGISKIEENLEKKRKQKRKKYTMRRQINEADTKEYRQRKPSNGNMIVKERIY